MVNHGISDATHSGPLLDGGSSGDTQIKDLPEMEKNDEAPPDNAGLLIEETCAEGEVASNDGDGSNDSVRAGWMGI